MKSLLWKSLTWKPLPWYHYFGILYFIPLLWKLLPWYHYLENHYFDTITLITLGPFHFITGTVGRWSVVLLYQHRGAFFFSFLLVEGRCFQQSSPKWQTHGHTYRWTAGSASYTFWELVIFTMSHSGGTVKISEPSLPPESVDGTLDRPLTRYGSRYNFSHVPP